MQDVAGNTKTMLEAICYANIALNIGTWVLLYCSGRFAVAYKDRQCDVGISSYFSVTSLRLVKFLYPST